MKIQNILNVSVIVLAVGCGSGTGPNSSQGTTDTQDKEGSQAKSQAPNNLNDIWTIVSKDCSGTPITPASLESYRFDANHLVKIELASKTDTSLCKVGYVYDRIDASFSGDVKTYQETSTLSSSLSKTSCWTLQGGAPVGAPVSNVIGKFGPETLGAKITATSLTVAVDLSHQRECPNGTLHLALSKIQ